MATEVLMPALSPTMEEGTLAKWLVREGDTVSSGDILAEIETDKATMEFEAVDEGIVGKILISEGTEGVKVKTPIAILVEEGEDASEAEVDTSQSQQPVPKEKAQNSEDQSASGMAHPAPAAPTAQRDLSPDWPADATMKSTTVREALRDAMAEEMRQDENVFVMGEEVAEYQGAYKITQGLL